MVCLIEKRATRFQILCCTMDIGQDKHPPKIELLVILRPTLKPQENWTPCLNQGIGCIRNLCQEILFTFFSCCLYSLDI